MIPDPFFGDNEKKVQWVGTTDWEYVTSFHVDAAAMEDRHAELLFQGLDTFADVFLNGQPVLHADNMFRSWPVDVSGHLRPDNELRIVFHSPITTVAATASGLPYIIPGTGYEPLDRNKGIYPTSQFVRKAGYSFGWDWGPRLVTEGIWRPITLMTWSGVRVVALHLQQLSVNPDRAIVEGTFDVDSDVNCSATLAFALLDPRGHQLPPQRVRVHLDRGGNHFVRQMRVERPQLWWPNGYGPQSLYTLRATLGLDGKVLATQTLQTGLRSLELRREADSVGKSFTFVVNGVPVFAKGADFVPLDSFPANVTPVRRLNILTAARDANMNMLRVWGGGYYEPDDFYEDADRLGLMIWHDFMFGGSMIPDDPHYADNVRAEAVEQVTRLSDHPSMALWCGNNEVETAWESWGDRIAFKKTLSADQQQQVWQNYLLIFHDVLKSAVAQYGNGVPYWPSSPSADFEAKAGDVRNGDVHSWNVWSGGAPYRSYGDTTPRFLSEFGFQSLPERSTLRSVLGDDESLTSPLMLNHERFLHGFDRMQQYLEDAFRPAKDFDSMIYLSQLEQAEAIRYAVETMRSRRPRNMGTLFWQLDDCWPVASWSSLDYFGHPKALQFFARRFYAPLLIVASQPDPSRAALEWFVVSDQQAKVNGAHLTIRVINFQGEVLHRQTIPLDVTPLTSTLAGRLDLENLTGFDPKQVVLSLVLSDAGGATLATQTAYLATAKQLSLPDSGLEATLALAPGGSGYVIHLRTRNLARAVAISFDSLDASADVTLSDNFIDILPGEPATVAVRSSLPLSKLKAAMHVRSLEDSTR
nr:glycoside hydrolase family 2 protein [Bryocella elongata]